MNIDYCNSDDFLVRIRKLIVRGQTFSFEVVGETLQELLPHVKDGQIITAPITLLGNPKLRNLVGAIMLAQTQGRAVSLEFRPDRLCVRVGIGSA